MKTVSALLMLTALATPLGVGDPSPRDVVRKLGSSFDRGIRARDYDALASIYAPDALYVQDDGPIRRGREAIRRQWIADVEDFGLRDMSLEPLRVDERAGVIVEVGTGVSTVKGPRDAAPSRFRFKYVNVWRATGEGRWELAVDAYSGFTYEAGSDADRRVMSRP
jgi:uncharacterized protein (TIGR02246 family)